MKHIQLLFKSSIQTIYHNLITLIIRINTLVKVFFISKLKLNLTFRKLLFYYVGYLILLCILTKQSSILNSINIAYIFVYLQYIFLTIVYLCISVLNYAIFFNLTNQDFILLFLNYLDIVHVSNSLILYSTKSIEFFQLVILDFIFQIQIFLNEFFFNFLNYPLFILFAVLFFLTSFFSLLSLSYLGFYGVFILNFVSLSLLWASVIPYFLSIFSKNTFFYISLGK
jgi:hypothetical protein